MDLLELMKSRHSVREFCARSIENEKRVALEKRIAELNSEFGVNAQIFYDDTTAFKNATAAYGKFSGCANYIALVGKSARNCGYVGGILALLAQSLELNTCFVALTYRRGVVKSRVKLGVGEKVQCCLAIGYGKTQGCAHRTKTYADVVGDTAGGADNLDAVGEACLLAPTAMNQQKFKIMVKNGEIVVKKSGLGFYLDFDLGIVEAYKDLILGQEKLL